MREWIVLVFLVFLVVLFCLYFWKWYSSTFSYFRQQGIPGRRPIPIFGTCWNCWKSNEHDIMMKDYKEYGDIYTSYQGNTPYLNISHPELLRSILKDGFTHFDSHDRRTIQTTDDYTDLSLASLTGERWRLLRGVVGGALSPSTLKQNMELFHGIATKMMERWKLLSKAEGGLVDIQIECQCWLMEMSTKGLFSMDGIDIIGHPKHPFVLNAEQETGSFKETFLSTLKFLYPEYSNLLSPFGNPKSLGHKYFVEINRGIFKARSTNKTEGEGNDMINMLRNHLEKENLKYGSKVIPDDECEKLIISQIAGELTGSHDIGTVLGRILHCLAMNPNAQSKARKSIEEGIEKHNGITFDMIREIPYLEQCIYETLRLYSTFNRISRVCNKEIRYGNLFIPVGTVIRVPSYAMDHDPKYYTNPYKFDPERFSREEAALRHPMWFLPFGAGQRDCPARFMNMLFLKFTLSHALHNFNFVEVPQTVDPLPCKSGLSVAVAVMQPMWLGIQQLHPHI